MEIQLLLRLFSNAALTRALMVAVLTTCMLTGCAGTNLTATPYQPAQGVGEEGYSSHRLAEGKYKIMYKANSATSERVLKQYSQQRAAEIATERDYTWYRIISSETVDFSGLQQQQVLTAAPEEQTIDGAVTGNVSTTSLPTHQQCTLSGCEVVNDPNPVAANQPESGAKFYTITVQLGRFEPVPEDAIRLN